MGGEERGARIGGVLRRDGLGFRCLVVGGREGGGEGGAGGREEGGRDGGRELT